MVAMRVVETRPDKESKKLDSISDGEAHRKPATGLSISKGNFKLNSTTELDTRETNSKASLNVHHKHSETRR